jgi:arylsulfatase A-like enzyme
MKRCRRFQWDGWAVLIVVGWVFVLNARIVHAQGPSAERLNIIFILIDDLGWRDVGCYGNMTYDTPNVDRLASQGMRFTDGYAACNCCSPTRASIMTGKYPARLHLTDWIPGSTFAWAKLRSPNWTKYLPLKEVTIAEALKPAGYVAGHVGKWHLGDEPYRPEMQGFDFNFGGCAKGSPGSYFFPYRIPVIPEGEEGEFLTERLTEEALKFIETNRNRPFFLHFSHYTVHTPIQAKKEVIAKYRARGLPATGATNATFAAMVESMDQSVGRVMAKLEELGIDDRTVIFFMSDNGGVARQIASSPDQQKQAKHCFATTTNAPLREGKGSPYEGGSREPWIVKWPGVVEPGTTCGVPVTSVDFYPTILEIAGAPGVGEHVVDGMSIVPLLKQQVETLHRKAIYWHYPHYNMAGEAGVRPHGIVRSGAYKLIEYYEDGRAELYDLDSDIGETNDLAARMPEKVEELRKMLHEWLGSVDAQMPVPNPSYDPSVADDIYSWWRQLPTR